jgi:cephalosporin-C deacetylase-like acetyl esterase
MKYLLHHERVKYLGHSFGEQISVKIYALGNVVGEKESVSPQLSVRQKFQIFSLFIKK